MRFVCCPRNRNALPSVCLFPTGLNVTLNDQFPAKRIESARYPVVQLCTPLHLLVFALFFSFFRLLPRVSRHLTSLCNVLPFLSFFLSFFFFFFNLFIHSSVLMQQSSRLFFQFSFDLGEGINQFIYLSLKVDTENREKRENTRR